MDTISEIGLAPADPSSWSPLEVKREKQGWFSAIHSEQTRSKVTAKQ
jgi:hypothetical protein